MSKLRSVNTHFWNDNYVVNLDPIEKLLFLYLLTNDQTNMLGIYELPLRRIAFDTGIDKDMIVKVFKRFEGSEKVKYIDGYVVLQKFIKHQSYNKNMETSAIQAWNNLPLSVREDCFCEPILKGLKGLRKASEPIAEIEVEVEREIEAEEEAEKSDAEASFIPSLEEVKNYFSSNGYSPKVAERAYSMYQTSVEDHPKRKYWRDSRDNPIKNWKLKMQSVWFKDENKIQQSNTPSYYKRLK
jgi:hypothetical protein